MFCQNCGKEISNDTKFCSYCGAPQKCRFSTKMPVRRQIPVRRQMPVRPMVQELHRE